MSRSRLDLRGSLIDAYIGSIPLITLNVLWFLSVLPLVTAIPATGALLYATNKLAHNEPVGWQTFVEGFRKQFWRSWRWGLLNLAVIIVLVANLVFYFNAKADWSTWAAAVAFLLLGYWLTVNLYTFPLLLEQEDARLIIAFRNSNVILLKRPLATLMLAVGTLLIAVLSFLALGTLWIVITGSLCAYLCNRAALFAIAKLRK